MMSGGEATRGDFFELEDGVRSYYEVHGRGEPMLFIGGYSRNSSLFRDKVVHCPRSIGSSPLTCVVTVRVKR